MNKLNFEYILLILILIKQVYLNILYTVCDKIIIVPILRGTIYNIFHPSFSFAKGVKIRKKVTFYSGSKLKGKLLIGENSFINDECFIDYSSEIIIGSDVAIGMRSLILSSSHKISYPIRCGDLIMKSTIIHDNCWIGANVTIFPGVTIGQGCVISSGEIVRFNLDDNILFKNNTCIPIKK